MASQKITVVKGANDTYSATSENATVADAFTTLFSADQAVTGVMGYIQKVGLVAAGMAIQERRRSGSFNFL